MRPTALGHGPSRDARFLESVTEEADREPTSSRPQAKGKRFFAPLLFEGNLNALIFNHYLKEQLLKQLELGSLLIMDNASFHKTRKTRELIEESGHELLFLPPYSPDFNPIEKHFANLKKIRAYQPTDTPIDDIVRLYGY